jgi:hypothetical protein
MSASFLGILKKSLYENCHLKIGLHKVRLKSKFQTFIIMWINQRYYQIIQ